MTFTLEHRRGVHRVRRFDEIGAALLEALIALTILTAVGAAVIALAVQSLAVVRATYEADLHTRRADRFFRSVSLWPTADLDRHLGDREQAEWWMRTDRPAPGLYRVSLRVAEDAPEFLWTVLYRPNANELHR